MATDMCKPKAIEDITLEDLRAKRWCFYDNEEEGFNSFEWVIPDDHPSYSEHVIELELSEFTFANDKTSRSCT